MSRCPACGCRLVITAEADVRDDPSPPAERGPGPDDDRVRQLRDVLQRIDVGLVEDERVREFVESMAERLERYQQKTLISPKQLEWLGQIADAQKPLEPPFRR